MSDVIDSGVIEVALDLSSIDKQLANLSNEISESVEQGFSNTGQAASNMASGLQNGVKKIGQQLNAALAAVGVAAGGALATSLYRGYQRYTTIEDSLISMETQLGSATRAATMLDDVLDVVRGTPFNLDQFADAASRMVAFGAEAEKIPGYLEAIGEVSATKGGRANEFAMRLSTSFGQIAAMGRISNEELNQMAQAGVPALRILANEAEVTTVEMKEMISEGLIPADEAMDTLTKGILEGSNGLAGMTPAMAGTMEGLRETMTGALGGMQSAMARFGAEIVSQLAPGLTAVFNATAAVWDKLTSSIEGFSLDESSVMQTIIEFLEKIADSDTGALDDIFDTLSGISSLAAPLAAMAGAKGLGAIAGIIPGLGAALGPLTGGIGTLVIGLGALLATNEEFMSSLSDMGSQLMDAFAPLMDAIMPPLVELMDLLGSVLGSLIQALVPVISGLLMVLTPILDIIIELVAAVLTGLQPVFETVGAMMERLMPHFQMLAEAFGKLSGFIGPLIDAALMPLLVIFELLMPFVEMIAILFVTYQTVLVELLAAFMPIVMIFADFQVQLMNAVTSSPYFVEALGFITQAVTDLAKAAEWGVKAIGWVADRLGLSSPEQPVTEDMEAAAAAAEALAKQTELAGAAIEGAINPTEAWQKVLEDGAFAGRIFTDAIGADISSPFFDYEKITNFQQLASHLEGFDTKSFQDALVEGEEGLAKLEQQMLTAGTPIEQVELAMGALEAALESGSEAMVDVPWEELTAQDQRQAVNEFTEELVLLMDQLDGIRSLAWGEALAYQFSEGAASALSMQLAVWDADDALASFGEAVEAVGGFSADGNTFDPMTEGARELYEAALPLQQMLSDDLAAALETGSYEDATQAAADFRAELLETYPELQENTAAAEELFQKLGATDGQVEIAIEMSKDEEARQRLDLLQGKMDRLDEPTQLLVEAAIQEGDFAEALNIVENSVSDGVGIPLSYVEPDTQKVIDDATAKFGPGVVIESTIELPGGQVLGVLKDTIEDGLEPAPIQAGVEAPGSNTLNAVKEDIEKGIGTPWVEVKVKYVVGSGAELLRAPYVGTGTAQAGVGRMSADGVGVMSDDYDATIGVYGRSGGEVNMVKIEDATFMDGIDLDELAAQVRLGMVLAGESV